MKKRLLATLLAAVMLAVSIPFPALADSYEYSLNVELGGADIADGYLDPGDIVDVTVSIAGAGWSTKADKTGMQGGQFQLTFDKELLQLVVNPETETAYTLGEAFSGYGAMENPEYAQINFIPNIPTNPATLTDEKTVMATCQLQVVSPAPAKSGEITIGLQATDSDFWFGDITTGEAVDAKLSLVPATIKVDTVPPVIKLDGKEVTGDVTYYYQPVAIEADDLSTPVTLTLNGEALSELSLTAGGALCATDARGNSTTVNVTIDAALYNAAVDAADKVPAAEDVLYSDKAAIDAAQKAIDAVTDAAAKAKLSGQQAKVTAALTAWNAIDQQIATVEAAIQTLPAPDELKRDDATMILAVKAQVDALLAKGVEESDIEGYDTYEAVLAAGMAAVAQIQAVIAQINALPAAEDVGYADGTQIAKVAAAVAVLQAKYGADVLTEDELAPLTEAQAAYASLEADRKAVVDKIANAELNITTAQEDQDAITALRAEVTAMEEKGATFTADELKKLTDAEEAMAALLEQSEKAHAAVAALPAAKDVKYTDKDAIDEAAKMVADLDGKDTFTDAEKAQLQAAQEAYQAIEDKIDEVEAAIAALPDQITPDDISALSALKTSIDNLTALEVPTSAIEGYEKYEAAQEAVEDALAEIAAVAEQIKALPEADDVTFDDEAEIAEVAAAVAELKEKYGENALSAEALAPLTEAQNALAALKDEYNALIAKIGEGSLEVSLREADIAAITALRDRVSALEAKKAVFAPEDLKPLTAAEAELAELQAQSKLAHDTIAALPERDDVLYTDSETLNLLKEGVAYLELKGDTFTAEELAQLQAALNGYQDILDKIGAVEAAIAALPAEITPEQAVIDAVLALRADIETLTARKVPTDAIEGYETYTKAAEALEAVLAEIQEVKDMINALPAAEDVTFDDEAEIDKVAAAVNELQKQYGVNVLTTEELAPLTDAKTTLDNLRTDREQLVSDIANAQLTISLRETDIAAITALRDRVSALEAKKTTFTADELKVLTEAETNLAKLQAQSKLAHDTIANLPERDAVLYTDSETLNLLKQGMAALQMMGDTFTAEEMARIAAVEAGLKDLNDRIAALSEKMEATPATVTYSDMLIRMDIEEEKAALKARACTLDETTLGEDAVANYAAFMKALSAMEDELAALNTRMDNAMANWKYNDEKPFDAIRAEMDAAAEKYEMTQEQADGAFPRYAESTEKNAAVKAMLDDAVAKINALPETVTLDQSASVAAVTDILNALKSQYGLTEQEVALQLGTAYVKYDSAVKKLEELGQPQQPESSAPSTQQPESSATSTLPQTGDETNVLMLMGILVMSGACMSALWLALRRRRS